MLECAELLPPLLAVRRYKPQAELARQSASAVVAIAEKESE
ncbi:hypothetical protein [Aeromonas veronii]